MRELTLTFAADHPVAAGHFPGNPIIPGALLLAQALRCIERAWQIAPGPCRVCSAKFPHPARPGDRLRIEVSGSPASHVRFSCAVDGVKVLLGEVQWPAPPATT